MRCDPEENPKYEYPYRYDNYTVIGPKLVWGERWIAGPGLNGLNSRRRGQLVMAFSPLLSNTAVRLQRAKGKISNQKNRHLTAKTALYHTHTIAINHKVRYSRYLQSKDDARC